MSDGNLAGAAVDELCKSFIGTLKNLCLCFAGLIPKAVNLRSVKSEWGCMAWLDLLLCINTSLLY